MEELEDDFVADLRTMMNEDRFFTKEKFYQIITSLKVTPQVLEMAKKNN